MSRFTATACVLVALLLSGCDGSSSPDRGLIAYQSANGGDPDIWVMRGDGTSPDLVVTDASQPCLCLDGDAMAFIKDDNVFTINTDGTGLFNVTQRPPGQVGTWVSEPAISPAGDLVAFVVRAVVPSPIPDIELIESDGSNQRHLIGNGSEPAFSPDGSKIVFLQDNDIFTINTDGSNIQKLTTTGVGVTLASPSFSPSGDTIVYAWAPVVPSPVWIISILDVATGGTTPVVTDGELPEFNARGDRVVFVRAGKIFTTDLQGTDVDELTAGPDDGHPSWE